MSAPNTHDLDTLFRVLAAHRRRYVLYYFAETETEVASLTDLTDQLMAWERTWTDTDDLSDDEHRDQLRIDLHHNHLPRLADANLLEYDARSKTIRQRGATITSFVETNADAFDRLCTVFECSDGSS